MWLLALFACAHDTQDTGARVLANATVLRPANGSEVPTGWSLAVAQIVLGTEDREVDREARVFWFVDDQRVHNCTDLEPVLSDPADLVTIGQSACAVYLQVGDHTLEAVVGGGPFFESPPATATVHVVPADDTAGSP